MRRSILSTLPLALLLLGTGHGGCTENATDTPNDTGSADRDSDGIPDSEDNCPATKNADQTDEDGNHTGDVCEAVGDFAPAFELLTYNEAEAFDGVTLFSTIGGLETFDRPDFADFGYLAAVPMGATGATEKALLPLWVFSDFQHGPFSEVSLRENGHILAVRGLNAGHGLYEIDPVAAKTVWAYDDVMVNHGFAQLPNGDLAFIYSDIIEHDTYGNDIDDDGILEVRMDSIRVIDSDDNDVWDWSLIDYDIDLSTPPSETYSQLTEWWSNCNALSFTPDADWEEGAPLQGNLFLNCRIMNRLYNIDYPSGDIEWIMGTGGDFGDGFFHRCHDPHITYVENDDGDRIATRILLYDNREPPPLGEALPCPPDETCPEDIEPYSRTIEIEVDHDLNAAIIWKWPSPTSPDFDQYQLNSPLAGGVQPLPNGNLLITNASVGGNPYLGLIPHGRLIELKRDGSLTGGEVVWDVKFKHAYGTFKAIRLPADTVENWTSRVEQPEAE